MNPLLVISTMRRILKLQVTDSTMPRNVIKFIFDEGLIEHIQWPGWLMKLTDAGREYIYEYDNEDDEG